MRELSGRAALVTGGANGIGRGTALALARAGVAVLVADIDEAAARDVADAIVAAGGTARAVSCDVADDASFEALKAEMLDRFGRIDIVMNNVGVITRGLPEEIPLAEWRRILDVNLLSVVRSNLAFLPHLLAQGEGHIVNTASFAGLYTYAYDRQPYAATKAAIVQMSEGLRLYLAPKGIGVTCLCPGPVKTSIMATLRTFGPPTETRGPGEQFALMEPEPVGEMVVAAIRENHFLLPTDPQVLPILAERAADWDGFLDRMGEHVAAPAPPILPVPERSPGSGSAGDA